MLALPAVGMITRVSTLFGWLESTASRGATREMLSGMSMSYASCCGMVRLSVASSTRHSLGKKPSGESSSCGITTAFQPLGCCASPCTSPAATEVMAEREAISPRLALLSVYRPVGSPAMHGQPVGSEYACDSSRRSPRVVSRPPGEGQLAQATRPMPGIHRSPSRRSTTIVLAEASVDSALSSARLPEIASAPGLAQMTICGAASMLMLVRTAAAGSVTESVSGTHIE